MKKCQSGGTSLAILANWRSVFWIAAGTLAVIAIALSFVAIAQAVPAGDAIDADRQTAITLRHNVHELVDLVGGLRGCFDLDPAADALEDGSWIKRVGRGHGSL